MSDASTRSLSQEVKIVWVEGKDDTEEKYDYVRWMWEKTRNKTGKPSGAMRAGRIIGYAELEENAEPTEPSRRYRRRVFYVKDNDRSEPGGQYQDATPHEAVDPRTVRAGVHGRLTNRARGRRPVPPKAPSSVAAPESEPPSDGMLS
ncbi:DUF6009 family protein [Streptomyces sp. WZ-12]|uniref:DUF6009 family protein n=1 Tax=Streptomyces sp. WZ-12 TaxID=3030210 RepID=UPI002380E7FE|nr:DUF6009 family protein [Streptomyces sp. WZ-12]